MLVRLALAIMIELEVSATGVRDLNRILECDSQLGAVSRRHCKVDSNHDVVCLEFDASIVTWPETPSIFSTSGLEPYFAGAPLPELRKPSGTQLLSA